MQDASIRQQRNGSMRRFLTLRALVGEEGDSCRTCQRLAASSRRSENVLCMFSAFSCPFANRSRDGSVRRLLEARISALPWQRAAYSGKTLSDLHALPADHATLPTQLLYPGRHQILRAEQPDGLALSDIHSAVRPCPYDTNAKCFRHARATFGALQPLYLLFYVVSKRDASPKALPTQFPLAICVSAHPSIALFRIALRKSTFTASGLMYGPTSILLAVCTGVDNKHFRFGIISDIQYANIDNGLSFSKVCSMAVYWSMYMRSSGQTKSRSAASGGG